MRPFVFRPNRVRRCYTGGLLLDKLRDEREPRDGFLPEDWIASDTLADNPPGGPPKEGVSAADTGGRTVYFDDLLNERAEELLGPEHIKKHGKKAGFLTKFLDSAVRLPLQAHPSPSDAKRIYGSDFGKTEAWLVLDTRKTEFGEPYLMAGFNDKVDKDVFVNESLTDGVMTKSLGMVHKHPVKAGDVLLVRGGMVHAIGPGVFLIEIMEPTDLVTQPESECAGVKLPIQCRFGKVPPEKAMEIFNFTPSSQKDTWDSMSLKDKILHKSKNAVVKELVSRESVGFFGALKLELDGRFDMGGLLSSHAAGVVTEGRVSVRFSDGAALELKKGCDFFMPFDSDSKTFEGKGAVFFALPPRLI
jgi:mannose-6-phosphate isomerase